MANTTYIYALMDPDTMEVRYVGKANDPVARLKAHIAQARDPYVRHYDTVKPSRKRQWMFGLVDADKEPLLAVLEEVPNNPEEWRTAEMHWITRLRKEGHDTLNREIAADPSITSDEHFIRALKRGQQLLRSLLPDA